jgi:hypothetical protein
MVCYWGFPEFYSLVSLEKLLFLAALHIDPLRQQRALVNDTALRSVVANL